MSLDRAGNLLGALALSVADRTSDAVGDAAGQRKRRLRVLGLTPSGTVRLVDRLEEAGYVEHRPGRDGREVRSVLRRWVAGPRNG